MAIYSLRRENAHRSFIFVDAAHFLRLPPQRRPITMAPIAAAASR